MDSCKFITLKVVVQENGIIRLADTGRYIARLTEDSDIEFELLKHFDLNKEVSK